MANRIPARLSAAEGRRFGLTVGGAFLVLAALASWRGRPHVSLGLAAIGGLLILGGVVVPAHLGPLLSAWMGLAHLLSKITTPIFLAVLYYGVLTPVGILKRLLGRRGLTRPPPTADSTGWIARAPDARRTDLERQF